MQKKRTGAMMRLVLYTALGAAAQAAPARWSVYEIALTAAGRYSNAYAETELSAEFRAPSGRIFRVKGFWDGADVFRIRFTPTEQGRWTYVTQSTDAGLNNRRASFEAGPPPAGAHGFLRRDPEAVHHWVRDDGSRFFMLGQTYYDVLAPARLNEKWKHAVDESLTNGLNKIRFRLHVKTCGNKDNPSPCVEWWEGDKDHLDLAQFRTADKIVQYLNQKGMIADLMPFDSSASAYGTPEQDARYLEYVIARYAAYPSVIWCLTNEYQRAGRDKEYLNKLGNKLQASDPWLRDGNRLRGLSIHPLGGMGEGDRFHFADQSWPSHVILQIGRWTPGDPKLYGIMVANREFGKPVVNDEFGYIGDSALWRGPDGSRGKGANWYTRENHRTSLWAIYMAGTYASSGDKNLYDDGRPYKSAAWHDAPEYADIRSLVTLFTTKGLEYWKMQPEPATIRADRVYCLGLAGKQYIVYTAKGGRVALKIPAGSYSAVLFDPPKRRRARARYG